MATSSLENHSIPVRIAHHANHSGAIELGLQSLFSLAHLEYDDSSAPFFADLLSGLRRLRDSFLPASPEHAPAQQHVDALAAALLARWRRATTPSIPPTTVATRTFVYSPSRSIICAHCTANSLVGTITTTCIALTAFFGLCNILSNNGNANAAVFPLPVCARPHTSLPVNAIGIIAA